MDIFDTYATDENLENTGTWVNLSDTAAVKVARSGTPAYHRRLSALADERRAELDLGGSVAERVSTEILIQVMAETILLDFKGLSYKKQPMEYSVDNAKVLLQHRDFRMRIAGIADDRENYKLREEAEQGNG